MILKIVSVNSLCCKEGSSLGRNSAQNDYVETCAWTPEVWGFIVVDSEQSITVVFRTCVRFRCFHKIREFTTQNTHMLFLNYTNETQ